jgi:hypothetical protein
VLESLGRGEIPNSVTTSQVKSERERHDSFKERVKILDHDHHESGQDEGPPVVMVL